MTHPDCMGRLGCPGQLDKELRIVIVKGGQTQEVKHAARWPGLLIGANLVLVFDEINNRPTV